MGVREFPALGVIGQFEAAEFAVVEQVLGHWPRSSVSRWRDVSSAMSDDVSPDVLVVVQLWSDEYSDQDVCRLIGRFPLARLICAYGPWCDGDGRSRETWPLAVRCPVNDFPSRLEHECQAVWGERQPLPLTASRTEIFEAFRSKPLPVIRPALRVAVVSPDEAWAAMLTSALQESGCEVVTHAREAERVVWDLDPDTLSRRQEREGLAGSAQVVLVSGELLAEAMWKLSPLDRIVQAIMHSEGARVVTRSAPHPAFGHLLPVTDGEKGRSSS